jgi:glycosyltransferase involved in cell wall biosynthesis
MHILIVNSFYYPDIIGGAEVSVNKLAEALAKKHKVSVICTGESDVYELVNDVHVYRVKRYKKKDSNKFRNSFKEIYNFNTLKKIKEIIINIKPEIIHTNNLYEISIGIWRVAKKLKIPVVHTIRDYYLAGSSIKLKNIFFKIMTQHVDGVTAPSNYTLNYFIDSGYFSKVVLKSKIFNANEIECNIFNEYKKLKLTRKGAINFAFIGRYTEEKGVLFLINSFTKHFQNSKCKLFLFGRGRLSRMIDEVTISNENIINVGFLDEKQLFEYLANIDVLIVPSVFQEPFGRVVIDAYKCAIPVIASDVGGLPEIVINNKTGLLFEANNEQELVNKMILFQERDYISMLINNIENELPKYDINEQIEQFQITYDKIIGYKNKWRIV